MKPAHIILTVSALALAALLYSLPKSVIKSGGNRDAAVAPANTEADKHTTVSSVRDTEKTISLRSLFESETEPKKKTTFADSLANLFEEINRYDSSAKYRAYAVGAEPNLQRITAAGNAYYMLFNFSASPQAAEEAAGQAKKYFVMALEAGAPEADIKSKLAMTYVVGPNPMEGITMLREVNTKYPDNRLAIFNLGLLAIRSGQLEKAVERFETLVQKDAGDCESWYYLAASASELGLREKAFKSLDMAESTCADAMMLSGIKAMKSELNKIQ